MELPRNITQIGEADRNCKIYVEDYVISYIKQVNQLALNKEIGVALYGVRKTEGNVMYLFIYGACKLDFLHRETRHLSQAQSQEIEKLRKKYFPDYDFQGYRLLNGEMVEGFHVYEQEICRYITGYAQFYEKNDSMLAYMLDVRTEDAAPEVVELEKYEMVKRRQEERRAQNREFRESGFHSAESYEEGMQKEREPESGMVYEGTAGENRRTSGDRVGRAGRDKREVKTGGTSKEKTSSGGLQGMRMATVAVFAVLCIAGVATLGQGRSLGELKEAAKQVMSSLTEQKLPDAKEASGQNVVAQDTMLSNTQNSTLIAEDKLAEVLQSENAGTGTVQSVQGAGGTQQSGTVQTAQEGITGTQQVETAQNAQAENGSSQPAGAVQMVPGSTIEQQTGVIQTVPDMTTEQQEDAPRTAPEGSADAQQAGTTQALQGTAGSQQTDTAQTAQETAGEQQADVSRQISSLEQTGTQNDTTTQVASNTQEADSATEAAAQPTSYIIRQGDTLIGISVRNYGTDTMVSEICSLNQISDPNDIKVGQKILLP